MPIFNIKKFELELFRAKCLEKDLLVLFRLIGLRIPVWTYHYNVSTWLEDRVIYNE
jgi:hypothetical protein